MQARTQLAANGCRCGSLEDWKTPTAKALLPGARDWRLVLQIGVDEALGLPGPGCLYVLMLDEDIRGRVFDRAWPVYQCD